MRNPILGVALLLAAAIGASSCTPSAKSTDPGASQAPGTTGEPAALARVKRTGVLRWGTDVVGGVPYVFEDPKHKGQYIGFEKDIAEALAQDLGVKLELVVTAWDTLIPELQRESFDMAMNGIEETPDRAKLVSFSEPYYVYTQQLTVRRNTKGVTSLDDLGHKTVATLSGTAAEDLLRKAPAITVMPRTEVTYCYRDLEQGKVDAVLLDSPIAAAYGATNPLLQNTGASFAEGTYAIAFRHEDTLLRAAVNRSIENLKKSGRLAAIYRRWGLLDSHQARLGVTS